MVVVVCETEFRFKDRIRIKPRLTVKKENLESSAILR